MIVLVAFASAAFAGSDGTEKRTSGLLLNEYFEQYLRDRDIEKFASAVRARLDETALCELSRANRVELRLAAILALGEVGTLESNPSLAAALKDREPRVRSSAVRALWAVWSRGESAEEARALAQAVKLMSDGNMDFARTELDRLIARSPRFAEAYNQRAILLFGQGQFAESAADCRRVVELNPYHFGALSGLGQCYLRLEKPAEALRVYRQALELQPHDPGLRELVGLIAEENR